MNDLISRQAAIDVICIHGTELERRGITVLSIANHKQATVDLLESLPSTQPEVRRGRWIYWDKNRVMCSECKLEPYAGKGADLFKYCPHCGSYNAED